MSLKSHSSPDDSPTQAPYQRMSDCAPADPEAGDISLRAVGGFGQVSAEQVTAAEPKEEVQTAEPQVKSSRFRPASSDPLGATANPGVMTLENESIDPSVARWKMGPENVLL